MQETGCGEAGAMSVLVVAGADARGTARLAEQLSAAGHRVRTARSADAAAALVRQAPYQIIVADAATPGTSGPELCHRIRAERPAADGSCHLVLLADASDPHLVRRATEAGADDVLFKPVRDGELLVRVRAWARVVRMGEQLGRQQSEMARLSGRLTDAHVHLTVAHARLATSATHDELTGLPNRQAALQRLEEAFADARATGLPLACALADVDGFKRWNETYGNAAGDRILRRVAGVLRACLPHGASAYRTVGDEFLLLFPGRTAAEATVPTERFRAALLAPRGRHDGEPNGMTVSAGVAELTDRTPTAEDLLIDADAALHRARRAGHDRVAMAA